MPHARIYRSNHDWCGNTRRHGGARGAGKQGFEVIVFHGNGIGTQAMEDGAAGALKA